MDSATCDPNLVPKDIKHLSACIECRLILNDSQWEQLEETCPNCKSKNTETSADFVGMISLMVPSASWVAKWNSLRHRVAGVYAISVPQANPEARQDVPHSRKR